MAILTHFLPDHYKTRCETAFIASPAALQAAAILVCLVLFHLVQTAVVPFYYFQF